MTAMLLSEKDPPPGAVAWGYAAVLGFALVYLGEHYVVDLLAGQLLAMAVNTARRPLKAAAQRLLGSGRPVEPVVRRSATASLAGCLGGVIAGVMAG